MAFAARLRLHLLNSGVPIGCIAMALMLGTGALLGLSVPGALLGAAFCGTGLVYLADRALGHSPEDAINVPERSVWRRSMRRWIGAEGILLALGLALCLPVLHVRTLAAAAGIGALAGLHVWPLGARGWRMKAWGAVKPLSISGAWALGAIVLPVLEAGAAWTAGVGALVLYRSAVLLPNVLLADWRDRRGDAAHGVAALASRWTRRRVRTVALGCLGAGAGVALALAFYTPLPVSLLALDALGLVAMGGAVWHLRPRTVPWHMLAADLVVAWPLLTWAAFSWVG